mmetsp:Transcript_32559/g.39592  ORF Transcript_32559/g.39592 Transcript_32559/m.39592 type:complete len:140 (+) Transcript_32559:65-484(+)
MRSIPCCLFLAMLQTTLGQVSRIEAQLDTSHDEDYPNRTTRRLASKSKHHNHNEIKESTSHLNERKASSLYGNPHPEIGPWPECVGWHGQECVDYINQEAANYDPDLVTKVVTPNEPAPHRVYIVVDNYGVVKQTPRRG